MTAPETAKTPTSPLTRVSTESAMIAMLDRHGERQAKATTDGMTAIAVELREIRGDQRRLANRMLLLVGAVVLVAIVMMAGLTRPTYLRAGLDGIRAGSGDAYEDNVRGDGVERPQPAPALEDDRAPGNQEDDNEVEPPVFLVPARRDTIGIGPHVAPVPTMTL